MIDTTLLAVIVGFAALLFTVLWTDRKHDRRFDAQDERQRAMETDIAAIKAELIAINGRIISLEKSVASLEERMRPVETDIAAIKVELVAINERLDAHDNEFNEIRRDINVLGSKMDRAQGNLDVLVFGERGVPPPVLQQRMEMERQA